MASNKSTTTREDRAMALIESGAVSLVVGRNWSIVRGSGKASYRVSRDGCTCPDFTKRAVECKHIIAVRGLCGAYRVVRAQAKRTGRCRLPSALGRALANGTVELADRKRRLVELDDELFGPSDVAVD